MLERQPKCSRKLGYQINGPLVFSCDAKKLQSARDKEEARGNEWSREVEDCHRHEGIVLRNGANWSITMIYEQMYALRLVFRIENLLSME